MAEKGKEAEQRRLAEALRANLKRRKAAGRPPPRERRDDGAAEDPALLDRTLADRAGTPSDGERG